MQPHEQAQFFEMIGRAIAGQVQLATAPLMHRIKELEDKLNKQLTIDDINIILKDGDYATVPCVASVVDARIKEENENLTDADVEEIVNKADENTKRMISEAVSGFLNKDAVIEIAERICSERIPTLKDGEDGAPGKDGEVDIEKMNETILYAVKAETKDIASDLKKYVDELPKPKDGNDGAPGQDGKDGTSVTVQDLEPVINAKIAEEISKFSVVDGKDGKDCDMDAVFNAVEKLVQPFQPPSVQDVVKELDVQGIVEKVAAMIPPPENGKDGNNGEPGKDGAKGEPGMDGKSVTTDEIIPLVDSLVAKAVSNIHVSPSMVGTVIDREGCLFITLSDGSTQKVGVIVGRDGAPGKDGSKGEPGKDGRDLVDFKWKKVGDRTFEMTYKLADGTVATDTIKFDQMIYRNYWKEGRKYEEGDTVHHGGGMWVALKDTDAQPDTLNSGWQLAVKRGRTGAPGLKGDPGKNGKDGRDGRDLTQMGPDGTKWG